MTETNAPLKTWQQDNTSLRDNPPSSHSIFYFNKPIMFRLLQCKLFAHYDWLVVVLGCRFVSAPASQGPQYFKVNHSTSASCSRLKEEEFNYLKHRFIQGLCGRCLQLLRWYFLIPKANNIAIKQA